MYVSTVNYLYPKAHRAWVGEGGTSKEALGIKCCFCYENENIRWCFCKSKNSEVAVHAYAKDECTEAS